MTKVYSVKYTDNADLPKARAPISISGTKLRSVQVPFMTEGFITRIIIKQTSGDAAAAVVEILDSRIPFPPGEQDVAAAAADDVELYRIVDQVAVTSGQAKVIINQEYGYPFHNQDGTYTDNQRYIYIVIKPTGASGTTVWDLAITGHSEIG